MTVLAFLLVNVEVVLAEGHTIVFPEGCPIWVDETEGLAKIGDFSVEVSPTEYRLNN